MKISTCLVLILTCLSFKANSQRVLEVNIKPSEFALLNFETQIGIGTVKTRYGLLFSFRPSTQDSGVVRSGGSGAAGGYGQRYCNRLYRAYTIGLYNKAYLNKGMTTFLETDIFYRNWYFNKKYAEYHNAERTIEDFKGLRTENADVYCLKILFGKTWYAKAKRKKKTELYFDTYLGAGIRYQKETYQTFNGYVADVYYNYKKQIYYHLRPTPQLGIKIGFLKSNNRG